MLLRYLVFLHLVLLSSCGLFNLSGSKSQTTPEPPVTHKTAVTPSTTKRTNITTPTTKRANVTHATTIKTPVNVTPYPVVITTTEKPQPPRDNIYEQQVKLQEEQAKLTHAQQQLYNEQHEFLMGFQNDNKNGKTPQNITPYVATVVEWNRMYYNAWSPNLLWKENMKQIVQTLQNLKNSDQKTDIVVFPEYALVNSTPIVDPSNPYMKPTPSFAIPVPDPEKKIRPCSQSDGFEELMQISCSARDLKAYVVINVPELENCTKEDCNGRKVRYYNTNVMFDRDGQVIARYRKVNLYAEQQMDIPDTNQEVIIKTDFNRTFGIVTCFDIFNKYPTLDLINKYNVTDMILPVNWFNELPFLTAVQLQAAWAFSNNVVLLASGISNPGGGNTGSGIYLGSYGPAKIALSLGMERTQVLTSSVPPNQIDHPQSNQHEVKGQFLLEDLSIYTSRPLNLTEKEVMQEFCHGKFCCSFTFSTNGKNPERSYYMLAYHGARSFVTNQKAGIQVCAIIGCDLDNALVDAPLENCPLNSGSEDDLRFDILSITGFFLTENASQIPNTLSAGYYPLGVDQFRFELLPKQANRSRAVTMSLLDNDISIITFGIYGRDFSLDMRPQELSTMNLNNSTSGTNHHSASIISLVLSYLFFKLIIN